MYAYGHNLAITHFIEFLGLPMGLQISPHYRSVGRWQGSCGVFGVSLSLSTFKQPFNNRSLNKNEQNQRNILARKGEFVKVYR